MIKLIIFDIDGTIVDAYTAIERSINFVLKKLGCPKTSMYVVRRAVGHGDRNFIETFVDKKDAKPALEMYRPHHEKALLRYSKVIPGARKLLHQLKRKGYKLAIASNRPPKFSKILLRHLDLLKYFDAVACAKDKSEIKPKPFLIPKILKQLKVKRDEALYVGDMAIDVQAGRNAGVKAVAVLGGSSSAAELRKAKPCSVIRDLSKLLHAAERCQRKRYS